MKVGFKIAVIMLALFVGMVIGINSNGTSRPNANVSKIASASSYTNTPPAPANQPSFMAKYEAMGPYTHTAADAGRKEYEPPSGMGVWQNCNDAEKWLYYDMYQSSRKMDAWLQARGYTSLQDAINHNDPPPTHP